MRGYAKRIFCGHIGKNDGNSYRVAYQNAFLFSWLINFDVHRIMWCHESASHFANLCAEIYDPPSVVSIESQIIAIFKVFSMYIYYLKIYYWLSMFWNIFIKDWINSLTFCFPYAGVCSFFLQYRMQILID